jgi:hypothetical protein
MYTQEKENEKKRNVYESGSSKYPLNIDSSARRVPFTT